jgi:hypothetical protein
MSKKQRYSEIARANYLSQVEKKLDLTKMTLFQGARPGDLVQT